MLNGVREEEPVLLIDDIFGELDHARRNALLENLPEGSQKLITTTNLDWAGDEFLAASQRFEVEAAKVAEL